MKYFVGIDIGTSSAKVTLIDEVGNIIKESSKEYSISEPKPGFKEIDPEIWMRAVDDSMQMILMDIDAKCVAGIGVTGQMHTVIPIGEDGMAVRPALMWNDTRTASMIPELKEKIKSQNSVAYIANIISTGSPAANLLWLKENEPDNFNKMKKFLIGPDYIVYRLTGCFSTDYCESSTSSLLDLNQGIWSEEIQQMLGFPEAIYPEIKGTNVIAGEVLDCWNKKYGFKPGVKVIVGTGDNPAAAISTGCFVNHYPVLSLGTSGVMMYPKENIDFLAKGKNIMFSLDQKQIQILVQGAVQSCGSSMNWWMKQILHTTDFKGETNIDIDKLGENNLYFYPHLTGEKTIYADPSLRGAFIGIGTDTSRKDMSVAVMEGIAFGVKQLCEEMKIPKESLHDLKVTGGGSKNDVWMQILANVLDVHIQQLEAGAGAGYGMALCAAGTIGSSSLEKMISKIVKVIKVFSPKEKNVKLYERKYRKYLRIHDAMKHIYE